MNTPNASDLVTELLTALKATRAFISYAITKNVLGSEETAVIIRDAIAHANAAIAHKGYSISGNGE